MTRLVPVSVALGCLVLFAGAATAAEKAHGQKALPIHLASFDRDQGINIQQVKHGHHGHDSHHGHYGHDSHHGHYGHHGHHDYYRGHHGYGHPPVYRYPAYIYRPYPVYAYPTCPSRDGGFYLNTPRFSVGVGF